jgi:hypothetical protein
MVGILERLAPSKVTKTEVIGLFLRSTRTRLNCVISSLFHIRFISLLTTLTKD